MNLRAANETHFEVLGFFEEFTDAASGFCYGTAAWQPGARSVGANGVEDVVLAEDKVVRRGMKTVTIKAGTQCRTRIYPKCGKALYIGDYVRVEATAEERARGITDRTGTIIHWFDRWHDKANAGDVLLESHGKTWKERQDRLRAV